MELLKAISDGAGFFTVNHHLFVCHGVAEGKFCRCTHWIPAVAPRWVAVAVAGVGKAGIKVCLIGLGDSLDLMVRLSRTI